MKINSDQQTECKIFKDLTRVTALIPTPVYWVAPDSTILGVNEYGLNTIGMAFEDFVGKTPYELYPKEMAEKIVKHNTQVIQEASVLSQEETIKDARNNVRHFMAIKSPLRNEEGKIIGLIGTSVEITAQKEAEHLKNLAEKQKAIAESKNAQLMQTLAAALSHEIRTPLTVLSVSIENLQKIIRETNKETHPIIENYFIKLKRVIKGAATLTRMILTNLKISASQKIEKKHFKTYSMTETVIQSLEDYSFKPEEAERVHWKDNQEDFLYLGDNTLTAHIIMNLLKNSFEAIKEARKGEIWITLNTAPKRFNELIFKDTALGISPSIQEKLFTQFQSTKSLGTGTGLGLTFCRLVMQAYEGEIFCRSEENKYTEFILRFPKHK